MEYIVNEFIKEVKEILIDTNNERKYEEEKKQLDIPFMISALEQHLNDKELISFITDLRDNQYNLHYEDIIDGYYDYGKLTISLCSKREEDKNTHFTELDYSYSIVFSYDPREWGYCQCTEKDEDYRKDKGCCGHGCDWSAPAFSIIKEIQIGHQQDWNGDEHDYWEYEDNFYKSDKDLASEKAKRDKNDKIKYLQDNIKEMTKQLEELQTA
jgi:hypothetical protein